MLTLAGYVFRHLRSRPLRATLTAGAFAFSIGLLGFLWLLSAALEKEWSPFMAQRVIVTAKTSFFDKLPMAYLSKIEATPGVANVVPFDFVLSYHRDTRPENMVPVSAAPPGPMLDVYREADVPPEQARDWAADPTGAKLAAGEEVELHQVMISAEQTDISFRVAMAIRDKLVEAYQETMRMSV